MDTHHVDVPATRIGDAAHERDTVKHGAVSGDEQACFTDYVS
jgi:hypothetical protein